MAKWTFVSEAEYDLQGLASGHTDGDSNIWTSAIRRTEKMEPLPYFSMIYTSLR